MSTKSNKTSRPKVIKTQPTIFPLGFGVGEVEDGIVIIDFYDRNHEGSEDSAVIIESIAMSQSKARDLVSALQKMIRNEEK